MNASEKSSGRLKGKRVLVTGSGTGIGRGVALEFAQEGAEIALHYAHSAEGAKTALEEIRRAGGKVEAFRADLRSVDAARKLGESAVDFLGGMDILINNSGITTNIPFEEVTPEQFDTLYQVNIRAPFFLTQAVLPALKEADSGVIINMTSIHAYQAIPEHTIYAGTKGGLVAYTRTLAIELAPHGIRVNAIAPGCVPVENHYKAVPDLNLDEIGKLIPVGFPGTPVDIGRVAVFLASDEARFIVGQTLIVDGGTVSRMSFQDTSREPSEVRFGKGYVPGI